MQIKRQIDDSYKGFDMSVSPDNLVGPLDFEDATILV